jgi:bifunctional DNase/RNase
MEKVRLEIFRLTYSQSQTGAYALILGEVGGNRRLPIIIGKYEAQAIALGLENLKVPRPLTHDLFRNFAEFYGIELIEVVINRFQEGVFHAFLRCSKDGVTSEIDARTSDAVALAIRFKCPIYTYEHILEEAGVVLDDDSLEPNEVSPEEEEEDTPFSEYLLSDLEEMLQKAIENEEYEKASQLRDEIQRRTKRKNL